MEGYFPIMLKLAGRACLVVGGGPVAERRTASLLEAHAQVTVVSPELTEALENWHLEGRIRVCKRRYEPIDQDGMFLVVAATSSTEVNDQICRTALEAGRLLNMAEHPERGDFLVPSVVRRGKLVIAVSTQGASPSVAAAIRRQIETSFGEEYEVYLDFLSEFRLKVQHLVKDTKKRQEWFRAVLQEDLLGMIRRGEFEEWRVGLMERLSGLKLGDLLGASDPLDRAASHSQRNGHSMDGSIGG